MDIGKAIAGVLPLPDKNRFTSFYLHMNIGNTIAGLLLVLTWVATSIIYLITAGRQASPVPVRCHVNPEVGQYGRAKEEKM